MNRFYATFIPGLQKIIAEIVRERLPDVVINRLLDGAILFETALGYDTLNFLCFNNIFAVIDIVEQRALRGMDAPKDDHARKTLETHIRSVTHNGTAPASEEIIAHNSKKFRTFRIIVSLENKPAAIDETARRGAEQYIAKLSGLTVDRCGTGAEFWFLYRTERQDGRCFSLFMKRLTLRPSWEKSLYPGELPPPLAWALCRLADLQHSDIVLDPFCGYGSIPQAALKYFHISKCIAGDSGKKAASYTAARFKNRTENITLYTMDFRSLGSLIPEKSINAIITDPPWGYYQDTPVTQLYAAMFQMFDRLLTANGRMVILGGRTDELPNAAGDGFTLRQTIPILLSGKKAAIYLFNRASST